MPYTAPTLLQARTALAARLEDPTLTRWVAPELDGYLREALRTWNAWTATFRDRGSFTTNAPAPDPVPFYDLATQLPTLRTRALTNWQLITDLQYALLEPAAPGGTWTGTAQFDLATLTAAIERRRAQFLRETGAVVTYTEGTPQTVAAPGRVALDEAVLLVRRATWRPTATLTTYPLTRSDEWAADHYEPGWPAAGATQDPYAYSVSVVPPVTLQVIPPPPAEGRLDLLTINAPAAINPVVAAALDLPDDWVWVIKWGALADLLGEDGLVIDPVRAAYCEQRWQQGVAQAIRAPVVLDARIDAAVVLVGSVSDLDSYTPLWQLIPGSPESVALAGQNLLATVPPAGSDAYTITLDVVRTAPVPTLDADVLPISPAVYDAILDYAQHVAVFKEGAGQLEGAMGLLERASRAAGVDVATQQAETPARRPLLRPQVQDRQAHPQQLPAVPVGS